MRIKEVCKRTGLTDKAIRVYIANGLLSPEYTENYEGRKNYSFNDFDVEMLNKIALLRSYDFSISDIKNMLTGEQAVLDTLEGHIAEIKSYTNQSTNILNTLLNASMENCKSFDDLYEALSEAQTAEKKKEEAFDDRELKDYVKPYLKSARKKLPKALLIAFLALVTGIVLFGGVVILMTWLLTEI